MWLVAVAVRWWHSYLLIDSIRWDLRIQEHREKISILKIAFSDTFNQAIFLYREEVAKLTSWENSMAKYVFSNHGKSQRIISSFLYEFWWETGFTHKEHTNFRQIYFQSIVWYFVQVLNRLTSLRSVFIGKPTGISAFISISFISRQWLKLKVFDNWKNRRHRENRLLLLRIWLFILERDPWYPNSLSLNAWIRFTQNKSVTNFIFS